MVAEAPRLASGGILVRGDGQMLLTHHALGPFAGRWSMPLVGVAAHETAEDALARLLREMLGVEPGPFEFLDTIYLEGDEGERFVLNAFTCVGWQGEPALRGGLYDRAVWAPPLEADALDLLPEVRAWIAASSAEAGTSFTVQLPASDIEVAVGAGRIERAARPAGADGVGAPELTRPLTRALHSSRGSSAVAPP